MKTFAYWWLWIKPVEEKGGKEVNLHLLMRHRSHWSHQMIRLQHGWWTPAPAVCIDHRAASNGLRPLSGHVWWGPSIAQVLRYQTHSRLAPELQWGWIVWCSPWCGASLGTMPSRWGWECSKLQVVGLPHALHKYTKSGIIITLCILASWCCHIDYISRSRLQALYDTIKFSFQGIEFP